MTTTIKNVIEKEWKMFHSVNGEQRVSCQEDFNTFVGMRSAQFNVWSEVSVESYLEDLIAAEEAGWNMVREKYIRMMKSTDPDRYDYFKDTLPQVSEKRSLWLLKFGIACWLRLKECVYAFLFWPWVAAACVNPRNQWAILLLRHIKPASC